jgi:hypothetical protein
MRGFEDFLNDLRMSYQFDKEEVMDWLMEKRGGYYNVTTQGLDFSTEDLIDELEDQALISKSKEYAKGGETRMAKDGMKVEKIEYPTITLKEYDLNDDQAEIFAYIETRQELQSQYDAIRKNLMTKIARGQFDEKKAPKLFVYLVENGLKLYSKNFGEIKLSKQEKEEIANNMVVDFMSEAELGNYENETFLPKKYLAEDGMFIMSYDIYNEEGDLIESGLEAQDVVAYANMVWYYDMMDEDGEEIDDVDVAIDFLEQSEFNVERNNPKKSSFATKKRKIIRKIKK